MSLSNVPRSTASPIAAVTLNSSKSAVTTTPTDQFVDRRRSQNSSGNFPERRQFGSSHAGLSEAGRELAFAIDQYKIQHHRRYLTCDEMLIVLEQLGYAKQV